MHEACKATAHSSHPSGTGHAVTPTATTTRRNHAELRPKDIGEKCVEWWGLGWGVCGGRGLQVRLWGTRLPQGALTDLHTHLPALLIVGAPKGDVALHSGIHNPGLLGRVGHVAANLQTRRGGESIWWHRRTNSTLQYVSRGTQALLTTSAAAIAYATAASCYLHPQVSTSPDLGVRGAGPHTPTGLHQP